MNRRVRRRLVVAAASLFSLAVVLVLSFVPGGPPSVGPPVTDPHGLAIGDLRTVTASLVATDALSLPGQVVTTTVLEGTLPRDPVIATVLTDEDCTPDADGISHCRNRLEVPSGDEVVLQHAHRMADVACLSPGERIVLQRA